MSLNNSYQRYFFDQTIENTKIRLIREDSKFILLFAISKKNQSIKDFYIIKKPHFRKFKQDNHVIFIASNIKGSYILEILQKFSLKTNFKKKPQISNKNIL